MDHKVAYNNLIQKAQARLRPQGIPLHQHHIIPSSMGGSDDDDNLVFLTLREHMLAHTLLAMSYPNQWFSVELLALQNPTLRFLPRWKRRHIAFHCALMVRVRNRARWNLVETELNR